MGRQSLSRRAASPSRHQDFFQLKIDRSFVINMVDDPDHRTIVSTIISLARLLRHKVIAEGVDSEEQVKMLRKMECDEIQGYIFSRPIPAEDLDAWRRKFTLALG